jgi:signal transduction histidine kinase
MKSGESLCCNLIFSSSSSVHPSLPPSISSPRTPLNTVILGLQLLEQHVDKLRTHIQHLEGEVEADVIAECDDLILELRDNTTVAVNTLNDLINYDKIESKTFTIEKKTVKIWSVIRQTVGMLSLQAKEKKVKVVMEVEQSNPRAPNTSLSQLRVLGDSIKLGQVIRNLVSNALKFTPRGGEIVISGNPLVSVLISMACSSFLNSEI